MRVVIVVVVVVVVPFAAVLRSTGVVSTPCCGWVGGVGRGVDCVRAACPSLLSVNASRRSHYSLQGRPVFKSLNFSRKGGRCIDN